MGYVGAGVGGSCRGGVGYVGVDLGYVGVGCIIQGWCGL